VCAERQHHIGHSKTSAIYLVREALEIDGHRGDLLLGGVITVSETADQARPAHAHTSAKRKTEPDVLGDHMCRLSGGDTYWPPDGRSNPIRRSCGFRRAVYTAKLAGDPTEGHDQCHDVSRDLD